MIRVSSGGAVSVDVGGADFVIAADFLGAVLDILGGGGCLEAGGEVKETLPPPFFCLSFFFDVFFFFVVGSAIHNIYIG